MRATTRPPFGSFPFGLNPTLNHVRGMIWTWLLDNGWNIPLQKELLMAWQHYNIFSQKWLGREVETQLALASILAES